MGGAGADVENGGRGETRQGEVHQCTMTKPHMILRRQQGTHAHALGLIGEPQLLWLMIRRRFGKT